MRVNQQAHACQLKMNRFECRVLELAEELDLDDDELICALSKFASSMLQRQLNRKFGVRSPGE